MTRRYALTRDTNSYSSTALRPWVHRGNFSGSARRAAAVRRPLILGGRVTLRCDRGDAFQVPPIANRRAALPMSSGNVRRFFADQSHVPGLRRSFFFSAVCCFSRSRRSREARDGRVRRRCTGAWRTERIS